MEYIKVIVTLFVILLLGTTSGFLISAWNSCFPGNVIWAAAYQVSFPKCASECYHKDGCTTVVYHPGTKGCHVIGDIENPGTDCVEGVGMKRENINEMVVALSARSDDEVISQKRCSTNQLADCTVLGNRNDVSSKVVVICPYNKFQCGVTQLQCDVTGTWLQTNCIAATAETKTTTTTTTTTPTTTTITTTPTPITVVPTTNSDAFQISTYENYAIADRARDGGKSGYWRDSSCSATQSEQMPWWALDMRSSKDVTDVVIYTRVDCCTERFNSIWITVSQENNDPDKLWAKDTHVTCASYQGPPKIGENPVSLRCEQSVTGRYLWIQKRSEGILTLCEVIVHVEV